MRNDAAIDFVFSGNERADGYGDPLSFLDTGNAIPDGTGIDGSDSDLALAQVVLVSILSWRRAGDDDELPTPGERNGWWGDAFTGFELGSRFWLFARTTVKPSTPAAAVQYAQEALTWLVTDGVAARVEATAEADAATGKIVTTIAIYRDDGSPVRLQFADLWGSING